MTAALILDSTLQASGSHIAANAELTMQAPAGKMQSAHLQHQPSHLLSLFRLHEEPVLARMLAAGGCKQYMVMHSSCPHASAWAAVCRDLWADLMLGACCCCGLG